MAEYIERESAMQIAFTSPFFSNALMEEIKVIPAADVAPVVHGRYVGVQEVFCCSVCWYTVEKETPYCPNCGAKMDKN